MSKRKILYIGGFELPDKNAAAHRVITIGKALKDSGCDVIFLGANHYQETKTKLESTRQTYFGFDCYSYAYPHGAKDWLIQIFDVSQYIDFIEKIGDVTDLILYNFPSIAERRLINYCHKHHLKCYGDITEWYTASGQGYIHDTVKVLDSEYRMRVVNKKLDGIIAISRFLQMYYKDFNCVYIPPVVDTEETKWVSSEEKKNNCLNLIYAGDPGNKDRIELLISALKNVKRPCCLNIYGITKEQYLKKAPEDRDFINKAQWLRFHGRCPHSEILDVLKRSNYSCFFRFVDRVSTAGFSTKFVEAITCGVPVLSNRTSNLSEYTTDGMNAVLVDCLDPLQIAKTIESLPLSIPVDKKLFDYRKYIEEIDGCIKIGRRENRLDKKS